MDKETPGLVTQIVRGKEVVYVMHVPGQEDYRFEPKDEASREAAKILEAFQLSKGKKAIDLFIKTDLKRQGIKKSWFKFN